MNNQFHLCPVATSGISIERGAHFPHKPDSWSLVVTREATEDDLEDNPYLEHVGDEIWSTIVEVAYCPFCGEMLGELKNGDAEFAHFDSSDWTRTEL